MIDSAHQATFFRPVIFFLIASILTFTLHELSHAITAKYFGIPAELFPFYTNISRTNGTNVEKAIISAFGPLVSLVIGLVCLFLFGRHRNPAIRLFLLYITVFGISMFLGNMFSASMAGDFHRFFSLLSCPSYIMRATTFIGLLSLMVFMYFIGKSFLSFRTSNQQSKANTILSLLVLPWFLGTALTIILYLPLAGHLIGGIMASSLFWVASIIGAWRHDASTSPQELTTISIIDILVLACCTILVRFIHPGISF